MNALHVGSHSTRAIIWHRKGLPSILNFDEFEEQEAGGSDGGHGSYHYTVYFELQTDGSFAAVVFPTFPEIVTFGRTLDEARAMARDALRCHLEGLRKDGEPIPSETPPRGSRFAKR
jgi:predicted RNase H-like HicB family nuclease